MKNYTELLRREEVLRRLTTIQFLTYFGAWLVNIAIFTMLVEMGASATWIGLIASAHFLMGVFQAPITGTIIDRLEPKKIMVTLLLVEIFSTTGILFIDSLELLPILFLLVLIRMGASSFYFTAEMSLLPKILSSEDLKLANELHSMIWSFTYSIGVAIGGLGVYLFSVETAFIVDIALFILSLILLLKLKFSTEKKSHTENFFSSFRSGVAYVMKNRKVLHLMLLHSLVGLLALDSLVTVATDMFYRYEVAVPIAIGAINSLKAFALVFGTALFSKFLSRDSFFYFLIFQGVSVAVWGLFFDSFYLSLFGAFMAGLVSSLIWSYTYTLIQEATDSKFYGRVIAYNDMLFLSVSSLTAYLTASAIDIGINFITIFLVIAVMYILSGFYYKRVVD